METIAAEILWRTSKIAALLGDVICGRLLAELAEKQCEVIRCVHASCR